MPNVFALPACSIHPGPDHASGASADPAAGGPLLAYAATGEVGRSSWLERR